MGGIYGGLVERAPSASGGAGTGFGSALFVAAGLPALKLGQGADELKPGELASSYAAHLVYGATTELGRRLTRAGL